MGREENAMGGWRERREIPERRKSRSKGSEMKLWVRKSQGRWGVPGVWGPVAGPFPS